MTLDLVARIVQLDEALAAARIPHAFGGALALAWCTQQARGTIDIDLNVLVTTSEVRTVCEALPDGVAWSELDLKVLQRDGQVRLFWDQVPVDLFFNTTAFHEGLAERVRVEGFAGRQVPFLSCTDLAVFKAIFNRPKDWVDLAEMAAVGALDGDVALGVLTRVLGLSDARVGRMRDVVMGHTSD